MSDWGKEDRDQFLSWMTEEKKALFLAVVKERGARLYEIMKREGEHTQRTGRSRMLGSADLHWVMYGGIMPEFVDEHHFRCVGCGSVYKKGWSDEEARNEAINNFGPSLAAVSDHMMCDDCYNKIHPHKHPEKVAAAVLKHLAGRQQP